jgi:hypothetical protein
MVRWDLVKFEVKKTNKSTLNFETEIVIPETYKDIMVIYDGKQFIINGSELKQDYHLVYEIKSKLESLLGSSLIKELSKHSRNEEYLRGFSLTKISVYPEGTLANLRYVYNNKFLEFGSVLVIPPYKGWEKLCKVPLTVETNAVSNIKLFYELLSGICRSAVMINANVNTVNEILKILLQKIGINES